MRAALVRSGGLGGLVRRWSAEPPSLDAEGEARLREALARCGFFELPPVLRAEPAQPDRFGYTLEVDDGGRRHAVRFDEGAASEELLDLVALVQELAAG